MTDTHTTCDVALATKVIPAEEAVAFANEHFLDWLALVGTLMQCRRRRSAVTDDSGLSMVVFCYPRASESCIAVSERSLLLLQKMNIGMSDYSMMVAFFLNFPLRICPSITSRRRMMVGLG